MAWTKANLAKEAFAEIGLAAYAFDISREELSGAIRRMDGMMAEWNAKGIRIGYTLPSGDSETGANPDQDANVPDTAVEAIRLGLAKRLAPSYGKTLSPQTLTQANDAYLALLSFFTTIPSARTPAGVPAGVGNRFYRRPFLPSSPDPLQTGSDDSLEFN